MRTYIPRVTRLFILSLLALCGSSMVAAAGPAGSPAMSPEGEKIMSLLAKNLTTGIPAPRRVEKTAVANLWEVELLDGNVIYTDSKAQFIFVGALVELSTKANLTQAKVEKLSQIKWSDLPLSNAIKEVRGTGERQVAIFTDPNCPYCKKMEVELEKMQNVTIYNFLIPALGEESRVRSARLLCASDKLASWKGWMVNGHMANVPATASPACEKTIADNAALAARLSVNSTPTIYYQNGMRTLGMVSATQLDQNIKKNAK